MAEKNVSTWRGQSCKDRIIRERILVKLKKHFLWKMKRVEEKTPLKGSTENGQNLQQITKKMLFLYVLCLDCSAKGETDSNP